MNAHFHQKLKIAIVSMNTNKAREAKKVLDEHYQTVPQEEANVIVALGGDGFMLDILHRFMGSSKSVFGMNQGSIGFLMNRFQEEGLLDRINKSNLFKLHPLKMKVKTEDGAKFDGIAINEVSLFRQTRQAAKLRIRIDGVTRLEEMICDGVLVATPAGSTAYNLSVSGPVIPFGAKILALTPISAFRPRRWKGALLPNKAVVEIEVLESLKRPVSAVADNQEIRHVKSVQIKNDNRQFVHVMFDPEHNLEERILGEQFLS